MNVTNVDAGRWQKLWCTLANTSIFRETYMAFSG